MPVMSPLAVLPEDTHNARLLLHTHPADWRNPVPRNPYNLVVVGAGPAGLIAAAGAAGLGARVALVERRLMGGDCLNYGCVPSKALLRCATALADVRDASHYGMHTADLPQADFGAIMERLRRLRADLSAHDAVQRFADLGVDVFLGHGQFTGPRQLDVAGQTLTFARAVIATGSHAGVPPIPGLAESGYLTNETIFALTERPTRLGVIGGGPIGCELAQAFQRLGSEVTLLEADTHLLPREDAEAAAIVQQALCTDGVQVLVGAKVAAVETQGARKIVRYTDATGQPNAVELDALLVATGRVPNVEHLGLEAAGVTYDRRLGVQVDDRLRTTNPRIFAAGDVSSRYQFTHAADALARLVLANALFFGRQKASALTIPWCTYTDPQIAHVGLTAAQAAAAGIAVTTFTQPLQDVDRAVLDGETAGFARVHVRQGTTTIVGATIVARHAGEMIGLYTTLMTHRLGLNALTRVIQPYPTQAEAVRKTGDLYNRTRLTPFVKQLMSRWLAWQRGR
ncbi:MAG: mercuric reductase [Candidatus Tectomicrobia bacterium]|uniref:Mercuric reductase n=1 Tax=Tectimicrobiota bacterium TaxID=2528274 RepID=A0A938B488_UNCTE|nr:mercuric reductase [Candidatus Tectomicrobia bacterium]